ncbi:MAG: hypothetical protein HW416_2753 [Chloroflexi bacterium]|nr:hypothetical protein [Chloroflexota bacterium]
MPIDLYIGDVVRLRKPHPCGSFEWTIVRLGADIGLRCEKCSHRVMLPRTEVERRLVRFTSRPARPDPFDETPPAADTGEVHTPPPPRERPAESHPVPLPPQERPAESHPVPLPSQWERLGEGPLRSARHGDPADGQSGPQKDGG